jgi:hypothetical protein
MRTAVSNLHLPNSTIPLLDSSSLPAAEDWALVEALGSFAHDVDPDEDQLAGFSFGAEAFD